MFRYCKDCDNFIDKLINDQYNSIYNDMVLMDRNIHFEYIGNLFRLNYTKNQFKIWRKLINLKKFDFWKYNNIKYISDSEFYHHIRLNKDQFYTQCFFIKHHFDVYLESNNGDNSGMWYYYDNIKKNIFLKNDFDDIWICMVCFIMLISAGGHINDILYYMGISYKTFKKYYNKGAALSLSLYSSFFCSKSYWNADRLKNSVVDDFKIIYGYIYFYIFIYNYIYFYIN